MRERAPRRRFSARVTGSRWSGLTHARLRHRWSRSSPGGISPTRVSYDHLCALMRIPSIRTTPYPDAFKEPVQFQQNPVGSTYLANLSSAVLAILGFGVVGGS